MIYFCLYIASIVLANLTLALVGVVPIGFGLMAPAGVLWAGAALTLRDLCQDSLGRWWVLGAIVLGAALSWLIAPSFALASGVAFLVSELCDFGVYSPLRRRTWLGAIALSNTVGLMIDSALFLWLSGLPMTLLLGLCLAKLYVTVATVAVLALVRQYRRVEAVA